MTGILWFDIDTKRLVRLVVQPEGRWELTAGLQGALRRIPLVRTNALGEVDFLSIDYGPDLDGSTVPLRALLRGRAFWLSGLYEMPIDIEWASDWDERDDGIDRVEELPPPLTAGWDFGIPRSELNPFLRQLDGILPTAPPPTFRDASLAVLGSARFNRVQGLSAAARYPYPVGPRSTLTGELRLGTTSYQATGSVSFQHRRRPVWWLAEAYSRLEDANRWETTLGFWNSFEALLFGEDDGNYYLAKGVGMSLGGENRPLNWNMGGFFERHEDAPTHTDFSLFGSDEDDTAGQPNIVADEGNVYGVRGRARLQWGDDAQRGVVVLRGAGEMAWGDFQYRDFELQLDVTSPLVGPFAGAMRVSGGRVKGDGEIPSQRLFYLGGRKTVRGFEGNSARGETYVVLKAELGTKVPALRFVVFSDVGWAGDYGRVFEDEPLASVGLGVSFLDGVLRADFAWPVRSRGTRRLHIYSSGLF